MVYLNTELFLKIPPRLLHIGRVFPAINSSLCNVLWQNYTKSRTAYCSLQTIKHIYPIYSENDKMLYFCLIWKKKRESNRKNSVGLNFSILESMKFSLRAWLSNDNHSNMLHNKKSQQFFLILILVDYVKQ